jgi:hypothetical protein
MQCPLGGEIAMPTQGRKRCFEVSGWNTGSVFFMARPEVEELGAGRKRVWLLQDLQPGNLVSLREVKREPKGYQAIVFRVEQVGNPDATGLREIQVVAVHPAVQWGCESFLRHIHRVT